MPKGPLCSGPSEYELRCYSHRDASMFEFFRRLFFPEAASSAHNESEANARAWLDDLRQKELSMNARRRIAPDEPVKAPGIGHGSSLPVAAAMHIPTAHGEAQNPARPPITLNADGSTECDLPASDGSSCGADSD